MVRYIRNDEFYHSGVKGQRWGDRRYQYPDGSLTPLGREHYGYGPAREDKRDPADRRLAKVKATFATIKGYATHDYKSVPKKSRVQVTVTKTDKAAKARAAKKAKAEEAKARKEEEERTRLAEEAVKKANEEKAAAESKERTDKALSKRWADFTDEDLRKYTERVNLEAAATEAYLKKLDAPRKLVSELVNYGRIGVDAYRIYQDITGMIDKNKRQKVITNPQSRAAASAIMQEYIAKYDKDKMTPEEAASMKAQMFKDMEMVKALSECENYMTPKYLGGNNQNSNNQGGKKK